MRRNSADRNAELLAAVAANHRHWFHARGGENGIWSVEHTDAPGVRVVPGGYEWGGRPHWRGIDLDAEPPTAAELAVASGFEVGPAVPPFARTLPYREDGPLPPGAIHLGVR